MNGIEKSHENHLWLCVIPKLLYSLVLICTGWQLDLSGSNSRDSHQAFNTIGIVIIRQFVVTFIRKLQNCQFSSRLSSIRVIHGLPFSSFY